MSTTRIKEKISAIVSSQLPEFIQNDYPTFVAFIEAYYRFLEQDQGALEIVQNAQSYNDIDTTVESFIQYFLKNYASIIPKSVLVDSRLLVKKINDLYESKGSELSFKLLFRTLYDSNIDVTYPYEFVLRPSDGRWDQRVSLRVRTTFGDRNTLLNRVFTYVKNGITYETPIIFTKILTSELTEIFLDKEFLAPSYTVGDSINVFEGGSLVFTGVIEPMLLSFTVVEPGVGFKIGQVFTLNSQGGADTIVKITGIDQNTGVKSLDFINYGYGYPFDPMTISLDADKNVSVVSDIIRTVTNGTTSKLNLLMYEEFNTPNLTVNVNETSVLQLSKEFFETINISEQPSFQYSSNVAEGVTRTFVTDVFSGATIDNINDYFSEDYALESYTASYNFF